jgi:hypothetical protein
LGILLCGGLSCFLLTLFQWLLIFLVAFLLGVLLFLESQFFSLLLFELPFFGFLGLDLLGPLDILNLFLFEIEFVDLGFVLFFELFQFIPDGIDLGFELGCFIEKL